MFSNNEAARESTDRLTILAAGLTVTGDIETDGVIRIEGTVEGSIHAKGQVLVAKGGTVKGNVDTDDAVIGGKVLGSLNAKGKVELEPGALVEGDLQAPKLVVQEGGHINGQVTMSSARTARVQPVPEREKAPPALAVG